MSRPWQYTRRRYRAMQAVMWLVLAATVGLAALVSRQKAPPVRLGQTVAVGPARLRVPDGWQVSVPKPSPTQASDRPPARAITVREVPAEGEVVGSGRVLHVLEEDGQETDSAYEYFVNRKNSAPRARYQWVTLGQFKWLWVPARVVVQTGEGEEDVAPGFNLCLCTVARPGTVVLVWLEGVGVAGAEDERLVKNVAASMEMNPPDAKE